jgi:hypothetical protein
VNQFPTHQARNALIAVERATCAKRLKLWDWRRLPRTE